MKEDTLEYHLSIAIEKRFIEKMPHLKSGCGTSCVTLIGALVGFMRSTEGMASMLLLGLSDSFIPLLDVQVPTTAEIVGVMESAKQLGTARCIYGWGGKGMGLLMPNSPLAAMLQGPMPVLPPQFAQMLVYHGKGVEVIEELRTKLREEAIRIYSS